jgi:surface antigen
VASYKWVNWRGNANQWINNARAKWHTISSTPVIGSIVQFEGRGYNPYYGHVAIVIDVTTSHIIVSDMNYRRKYEVTTRKVPRTDRTIKWYIYVN